MLGLVVMVLDEALGNFLVPTAGKMTPRSRIEGKPTTEEDVEF
jgi:hypothetical protein